MRYEEAFNNLQTAINQKGQTALFKESVTALKDNFGVDVSTKFLIGLSDLNDTRKKTKRINYLIRKTGFKTKKITNIREIRGVNKHKSEVVIWGHDKKNKPFPEAVGLTDSERRQLQEIRQLKEKTGVCLFDRATQNLNDRQKTREAFNWGGSAVVRDVKVIDVGVFAVEKKQEVLFMVC